MEKDFPSDYHKGLQVLEDIVQVAGAGVAPMAAHALFHFSKLKPALNGLDSMPVVRSFLESAVCELAQSYMLEKFPGQQISVCTRPGPAEGQEWDRLLECLPALLELRSFFRATGPLSIELSSGKVSLKGNVALDEGAKEHRARAYQIYRKLFTKRVLACYEVGAAASKGEAYLTLECDLGDDHRLCFAVDMGNEVALALPSSFARHVCTDITKIGDGPCLEITDRFTLINHRRFPMSEWETDGNRQVIHFPFLFRPISLIIPYKGELIPRPAIDGEDYTGSGDSRVRFKVHQLDFFSLFST